MKRYQVIIVGRGLAALSTAVRLTEQGVTDILLLGPGSGGTPAIAAINFVLPDAPGGDTPERYAQDMMRAGYDLSDPALVKDMAARSADGYRFLERNGVVFAREADGRLKRRHLSGHSCPRSLCQTDGLIGQQLLERLTARLKERGVAFDDGVAVKLLSDGERIYGVTRLDRKHFNKLDNLYASVVVAAWGGVGQLFPETTYPADITGRPLAMAWRAGAALRDLEFLEWEPMVVAEPAAARGEPCPTAMLGEGAYLLNRAGERFILPHRPEGEAGAPKSLLNRLIWQQAAQGMGAPHGGCWVDLRHIPEAVLEGYPWFYNRVRASGLDPRKELVEVAPMAHSYSGGIKVGRDYQSDVAGLYAVGEAAGGVHGACRCAGNAASQAVLSGIICAEEIARSGMTQVLLQKRFPCEWRMEPSVFLRWQPVLRGIAGQGLGVYRSEEGIKAALVSLEQVEAEPSVRLDDDTLDACLALRLMLTAALARQESRGTHLRTDWPEASAAWAHPIIWRREEQA